MEVEEDGNEWMSWCRLCAKADLLNSINIICKNEVHQENSAAGEGIDTAFAIDKLFGIDVEKDVTLPKVLCVDCFALVTSLDQFASRVSRVQEMFVVIQRESNNGNSIDYHALHKKFDLLTEYKYPEVYLKSNKDLAELCASSGNENMPIAIEVLSENPLELPCLEIKNETDNNVICGKSDELLWEDELDNDIAKEENMSNDFEDIIENADEISRKDKFNDKPKKNEKNKNEKNKNEKKNLQKKYSNESELENNTAEFICSECQKGFLRMSSYRNHMKNAHSIVLPPLKFPCTLCSRSFGSKYLLQNHLVMHKPLEERSNLPCPYCDKKFHVRFSLQRHMLIHTGELPFKCDACPRAYREKSKLKKHKEVYHNNEEDYSTEIPVVKLQNQNSSEEELNEDSTDMAIEAMEDSSITAYNEAINYSSNEEDGISKQNTNTEIVCDQCQQIFASSTGYRLHMKYIHGVTLPPPEFRCKKCSRVFTTKSLLGKHLVMHKPLEERKVLPCEYCDKKFYARFSLQRHMMIHTGETPFKCNKCTQAFREKSRLKEHMQKIHCNKEKDSEVIFEDIYCEQKLNLLNEPDVDTEASSEENSDEIKSAQFSECKTNPQLINSDDHLENKNDEITCRKCSQKFYSMPRYRIHMKRTHNINVRQTMLHCSQCDRSFPTMTRLKKHKVKHVPLQDRNVFPCDYCDDKFLSKFSAYRHMLIHTGEKPFKCEYCPMAFREKNKLKMHEIQRHASALDIFEPPFDKNESTLAEEGIENEEFSINANEEYSNDAPEKSITCAKCPQKFKRMQSYRLHMKRIHHTTLAPSKYSCTQCDRVFTSAYMLKQHLKLHLPMEERKVLPCQYCDKKFIRNFEVINHVRHFHMNERYYICEECGAELRSKVSLNVHMLIHTGETPFKCELCPRAFREKSKLKNHMERHDVKKQVCPECGHQTNSRLNLRRHMLVHTDNRRFKCDYCGTGFKRSTALKTHLIMHIGLKPYLCPFCDRTFSTPTSCRLHKKTKHPEQLAALEASGSSSSAYACDVPTLETLKAIAQTSENLRPVGYKKNKS